MAAERTSHKAWSAPANERCPPTSNLVNTLHVEETVVNLCVHERGIAHLYSSAVALDIPERTTAQVRVNSWSGVPNCPAPASAPHLLTQTDNVGRRQNQLARTIPLLTLACPYG